jgi:hypothetical protein
VQEVLEAGREDARPWWRRRWAVAAVAVVVVGALAGAGVMVEDRVRRGTENDRLEACVRDAYAATDAARDRLADMAAYVQPGLREGTPAPTVDGLYDIVAESAAEAAAVVEPARRACAGVDVRVAHVDQLRLRTAVVAYLDLVLESFRVTSDDGREYFRRNEDLVRARRAVAQAQSMAGRA